MFRSSFDFDFLLMKFNYIKKLRFILPEVYFKKRAEPPISDERPSCLVEIDIGSFPQYCNLRMGRDQSTNLKMQIIIYFSIISVQCTWQLIIHFISLMYYT